MTDVKVASSPLPEAPDSDRAKALPLRLPVLEPPALVPARMINELLYCERLMYLEWAQGEWADNYFTVDGKGVHRRVDGKPKPLRARTKKEAEDEARSEDERPYTARSVWLSSERLGLTAKIDVVDVDDGEVVPIEYKRGKQPKVPEGAYLPERAQLCAQVLLLREHGFRCLGGEIYFAAERKRVPIIIDEALEQTVLEAIARARELARTNTMPPPLSDSPKCQGCSLVGICLPDEVNLLASTTAAGASPDAHPPISIPQAGAEVRRLYAARDDRLPLYVNDQGARVGLSGEVLTVQLRDGSKVESRLPNTSQVSLFGNVQISSQALRELMVRNVPVTFFSYGGWYTGRAVGTDSRNVDLKIRQFQKTQDPEFCLHIARDIVASKILNSRTLLRRNQEDPSAVSLSELKQLALKAKEAPALDSLLGIEGSAARVYFSQFSGMLKSDEKTTSTFDFKGRNRRPPTDPINALLSFCYSLLTKELSLVLTAVGLDPMLGFYHQPHFGRPGLALDLMEEFRPLIADSVVINVVNTSVVTADDFIHSAGAVALKPPARRRLILAFERRMDQLVTHPMFDYRVSYRRVLELQARLLTRLLLGEIPQYPVFRTR